VILQIKSRPKNNFFINTFIAILLFLNTLFFVNWMKDCK